LVSKNLVIWCYTCFYAKIGSETKDFDIADVCTEICEKLIHHPHIYSDTVVKDEEEVKQNGKSSN
jgi:XTP/dITP diphosphohydrolase